MIVLPQNISCGYFDCSEFGSLEVSPKRIVTKYEIEFYLADGKTTITDDNIYEIKKNYIQIAKPGQVRYSQLPFKTVFLKFDTCGEIADRLSCATGYFCSTHSHIIRNMMEEIILLDEADNSLLLYSKLLSLIDIILADSKRSEPDNAAVHKVVSAAKKFIEANYYKAIKLEDVAASVHLSPIHFHNTFTGYAGISPHQYLIDCRIENAKKLLWNTEIPIGMVAEKSGFGCQQYLNKVFKKETGTTPAFYRKSCQRKYSL